MSDALPLPPRPNLERYRKLAKEFQAACRSADPSAVRDWAARWAEAIARLQRLEVSAEVRQGIEQAAGWMEQSWQRLRKSSDPVGRCTLAGAQFFVARCHGFSSWPRFARHVEGLARRNSPVSKFEAAVEAIVGGDAGALGKLLAASPGLVRERSTREHRSTLLHYVSANGVEDFRQKTPANIVEIARMLLDAGADVNAESDAYGGRSTTLGLAATSFHPQEAGVQIPLLELLIARGALLDGPDGSSTVNACLHNGRGQAAEYLAGRGARLDLEGAAGVGRLDLVRACFDTGGNLKSPSTWQQVRDGFYWACQFGRTPVVEFLLRQGIVPGEKLPHDGQTGLHWAALGGHPETVGLLLEHGSPVDVKDETYGGTPLGWALYAAGNSKRREPFYEVAALLVRAGAEPDPEWGEIKDPRMVAALRGEMPE